MTSHSSCKRKFLLSSVILAIALAALCVLFITARPATYAADQVFFALADDYFDQSYFPYNPTQATQNGIHTYDDKLEDFSHANISNHIEDLKQYEKRVSGVDPTQLSEQAQGDRDLLLNHIRSQLLTLQTIKPWEKNPDYYPSGISYAAFVIIERQYAPAKVRLQNLIAREKLMPAALQAAKTNLKNPPKIYTQIALEQLPGIISFFQNDAPKAFESVKDEELQKQFSTNNHAVIEALKNYQTWLQKEILPKSNGDFRIGAETYRKKLMYDEMVDTRLDKLLAIGNANLRANQKKFIELAKKIDPTKTPQQVLKMISTNHPASDKILSSFENTFDSLIHFIDTKKIITIPSTVRPILEETPPFIRAITFASMDTPGPFEKHAKEAYFNVTLPEPTWSKEKTAEFMQQLSYPVINTIAVHEAYPGHYVQFLWMHRINDRVRKILGAASNSEGWAHYVEQMMLDEGFGKETMTERELNLLRFGELIDSLLRNARFIVGIQLHTGKMTFDQAVDFFVKEGYQTRTIGTIETKRGTADPTYLVYTLGKLEIQKLRRDLEAKEGDKFNLTRFHDDFMRQGFAPIKIVRKAMLHDDSATL